MNTERRDTGTASILPLPELLPHGAHIGAGYVDGAWGRSTDEERPASGLSGTVRRFKKGERASDKPI